MVKETPATGVREEAKKEGKEIEKEKEGQVVATLKVTLYDNVPAKVEFLQKFPGFAFRHIKLAKVGVVKYFKKMRKQESAKVTEIEIKQKEENAEQSKKDEIVREEKKKLNAEKLPTRQEIRQALTLIQKKEGK